MARASLVTPNRSRNKSKGYVRAQSPSLSERQLADHRELLQVTRSLVTELNGDNLLRLITEKTSEVLHADRATLFLVDRARNELWSKVAEGLGVAEVRFPASTGIAGHVATTGEVVNIPDAYADPRFNPEVDRCTGYRTKSILCAPIRDPQDQVIGVLEALNKHRGRFNADDEETLIILGAQAAVALHNADLVGELDKRLLRTEVLLNVMQTFTSKLELDTLLQTIMAKITQVLQADRASLFLIDHKTKELWSKVAQGEGMKELRFPRHLGIAGHVATTGRVANVMDAYKDARFNQEIDKRTGYRTRSVLCVPIRNDQGHIIGVTEVLNKRGGIFTEEDEDLLVALSSQVGIALENAGLFEQLQAMRKYNEGILTSIATGVVTLDASGLVTQVNPAAQRIFGLDEPYPASAHVSSWLDKEHHGALLAAIQNVFHSGQPDHVYHYNFTTPQGERVGVNTTILPLQQPANGAAGVVLVTEDVTQLMNTFARYVSPEVAAEVLTQKDPAALEGTRKQVSVLFSDIRGFTSLSECSTAEDVMQLLNQYFSRMASIVFKYGGTLDKYIGDAIMAVFGAPHAHEDDPMRAVQCAIEMRRTLWDFNQERVARGLSQIEIGVGICTGEVVSGNVGSDERMDYTVIGDAVNVASRLEGMTKLSDCKILFNQAVYEAVKERVQCELLGPMILRGRTKPVQAYGISDEWIRAQTPR
ncbi:MAG TPA: GAF domain-containing protein [Dehalococcoidia bacterium]|nr:GAF domain-containing protein [Dehalococcoidia bacterium]